MRASMNIAHGQRYEICRSVHAEQNAIINSARGTNSTLGGKMYIWGEDVTSGKIIDAFPCFICKKMIINVGIESVTIMTKKGIKTFEVKNWIKDWQKKDITDDRYQYGNDRRLVTLKYLNKGE